MDVFDSKKAMGNLMKYFRYLQLPVANKSELWVKYPNGGEYGMFGVETSTSRIVVWNNGEADWTYVDQGVNDYIIGLLTLKADKDAVYTKGEVNSLEQSILNILQGLDNKKANTSEVYTIDEINKVLEVLNDDIRAKIDNLTDLSIRKIYSSHTQMLEELSNTVILGANGIAILNGQLVMVADLTDISKDGVYMLSVTDAKREWIFSGGVSLSGEVNRKSDKKNFYNISQATGHYHYADNATARHAVDAYYRSQGSVLAYQLGTGKWIVEQYNGVDTSHWTEDNYWQPIGVEVVNEPGASEEKAVSQKLFSEIVKNRANGGVVNGNYLQLTCDGVNVGEVIEVGALDSIGELQQQITDLSTQLIGIEEGISSKIDDGYIDQEDADTAYLILTSNGEEKSRIELPALGGGGGSGPGTGIVMKFKAVGGTSIVAGSDTDAYVRWNFSSTDSEDGSETGDGTLSVTVNNVLIHTGMAGQGDGSFNVKNYISLGRNNVKLKITDSYGTSRTISYTVQKASLVLTSPFAGTYYETSPIVFRYVVTGAGDKTINFKLNGTDLSPDTSSASGIQLTKNLTGMVGGINTLEVKATAVVDGVLIDSNSLYFEFIYALGVIGNPVITSSFNQTSSTQFDTIHIPYFAYDPANNPASVLIYVDDVLVETTQVNRTVQIWEYRITQSTAVNISIHCGSAVKKFHLSINASTTGVKEVIEDLKFKVSAVGKSNSSSTKDSWEYGAYKTILKDFNWVESGWFKDANGNTALKFVGDANASINIRPFVSSVLTDGMTYSIEYSTANVSDDNIVIMEQMIDNVGIKITPTSIGILSAESGITRNIDSSERISISFVIQKKSEQRILGLYINGILSGTIQYSATDRFNHSGTDLKISTGYRRATVFVYGIRWYNNNLTDAQILGNYIYDTEDSALQESIYNRNNIIDAYNHIDYTRALNFIPCMKIIGELPTYKGDKKTNTIVFENVQDTGMSFMAEDVTNDVQGTSSQYYPRKNFKWKLNSSKGMILTESGDTVQEFALDASTLPAKVFCMKADFAESSGVHNTGMAIICNDVFVNAGIKTPEQSTNPKVRTTIYGFPCLVFHQATISSEPVFLGKYNFNYDKSAEHVFGFSPGCESWEFKDNTSNMCLFKSSDFTSTYVNDKGETVPVWSNNLEARYPDGNTDTSEVKKVFDWVISCKNNPSKFKSECVNWFEVDALLAYWVLTEHYACVDQRAKNQFLTKYSDGKWRFILYDNDTILGIDNIGTIKFGYNVETEDIVDNGHVFNGWDSALWTLVKEAYWLELTAMYVRLNSGKMTYDYTMEVFQKHQADKFAERVYNMDGHYKYIAPLIDSSENYLADLQGSRSSHRKWWLKNRFDYMNSRFKTGSYKNDFVSLRLYTPSSWGGVTPNASFNNLVTGKHGYVHIRFGQTDSNSVRTKPGVAFNIVAPNMEFNDTETIIYGASALKDLGDLSNKYLGLVDVTSAVRLEKLIIGNTVAKYSNTNFKNLSLGANTLLREINVAQCPNFGNISAGSNSASLDLSKLTVLENFNGSKTSLKSVVLPNSGTLTKLILPSSTTTLILKNQTSLTSFTLEGYSNLQLLAVENTANVNGYTLATNAINSNPANPPLRAIRLVDIDVSVSDGTILRRLAEMSGIDEGGNILEDEPIVTGKAYAVTLTQYDYDLITARLPKLEVSYGQLVDEITFSAPYIEALALETYDTSKKGYLTSDEVANKTWTPSLLNLPENSTFNELRYWMGGTSSIANYPKLTSVGIGTDYVRRNATLNNLADLTSVLIEDKGEDITVNPKLDFSTFGNCYELSKVTYYGASGRYSSSKELSTILGKHRILTGMICDTLIFPLGANIKNAFNVTSPSDLPLMGTIPNVPASINSASIISLNNVYRIDIKSLSYTTLYVNGIGRNMSHNFNNDRFTYINVAENVNNQLRLKINKIIINADTNADAVLHKLRLIPMYDTERIGIDYVEINAKCTPDDYISMLIPGSDDNSTNDCVKRNWFGTIVMGEQYAPALIPCGDASINQYSPVRDKIQNLVVKCATYNGEPYIPTITGKFYTYSNYNLCIIRNLYVPDQNIDLYRQQYSIDKIRNILPLSEYNG